MNTGKHEGRFGHGCPKRHIRKKQTNDAGTLNCRPGGDRRDRMRAGMGWDKKIQDFGTRGVRESFLWKKSCRQAYFSPRKQLMRWVQR